MNYFWVIGGGLLQVPIIEKLRSMDLNVIVSDQSSDCICNQISDIFFQIDIFDVDSHIEKAREILSQGDNIIGVLAAGIDAPVTMSKLNEFLGLSGVSSLISKTVHNKALFRGKMRELGFPTPEFHEFKRDEYPKFSDYLKQIGNPYIIKNVDSSASRGTKIFYTADKDSERKIFLEACNVSKTDSCLVESVWTGTEHTVETFYDIDGKFYECFITDRAFNYETGFPIETGLRNPTELDLNSQRECFQLANEVSSALGIKVGAAKFDMIFTNEGPRIIEMTTRLSGGFDCQYLVPAATGKDILSMAIITAMGKRFDAELNRSTRNYVALSGSIWPEEGIIESIEGLDKAKSVKYVENIFIRKKVGDTIEHYNNCAQRVCIMIVAAPSYNEANDALSKAISSINIRTK